MRCRWITIGATVAVFALSVFGMGFVQQQFFPSSDRPELIVDWTLPQNASIAETDAQMAKFEAEKLVGDDDIDHWSSYVGKGALRFVLSFDVAAGAALIRPDRDRQTKSLEARDRVRPKLQEYVCARLSSAPTSSSSC